MTSPVLSSPQTSLLDRIQEAAVVVTPDGEIAYVNAAADRLLARGGTALVGRPLVDLVPERFRDAHLAGFERYLGSGRMRLAGEFLRVQLAFGDGTEIGVEVVLNPLAGEGEPGPVLALIRPRERSTQFGAAGGVVLELVSVLSDDVALDEAVERLLSSIGRQLEWDVVNLWAVDETEAVIRCVGAWSAPGVDAGSFIEVTQAARFEPGVGLPGRVWSLGAPASIGDLGADETFARADAATAAGLMSGFGFPVEHHDRLVGVLELFRRSVGALDEGSWAVMQEVTASVGAFLGTAGEVEHRARSMSRLRIMAEANEVLARSRDYAAALQEVADLLVPSAADAAVIDLVSEHGLDRVAKAIADPERALATEALEAAVADNPVSGGPEHVARTGRPVRHGPVTHDLLVAAHPGLDPDLLARLVSRSTLIVPLVGRGQSLGVLTLATFDREPPLDEEDLDFAVELGRHLGLAVANAQLFEREHAVAAALQQSLLPRALPSVPDTDLAARFRAGGDGLAVGGDFYDVFDAGEGRWMAIVGDVCGTGAEAAAVTSQVRYTARALAGSVTGPALLLDQVNRVLLTQGGERFCTAVAATVEQRDEGFRMVVACAGHPPPVVLGAEGPRVVDECRGTLLGVYENARSEELEIELAAGESAVLYTDGVTEARMPQGPLLGEEGLLEALRGQKFGRASAIADAVLDAAILHGAGTPRDDIAILVVRRTG